MTDIYEICAHRGNVVTVREGEQLELPRCNAREFSDQSEKLPTVRGCGKVKVCCVGIRPGVKLGDCSGYSKECRVSVSLPSLVW